MVTRLAWLEIGKMILKGRITRDKTVVLSDIKLEITHHTHFQHSKQDILRLDCSLDQSDLGLLFISMTEWSLHLVIDVSYLSWWSRVNLYLRLRFNLAKGNVPTS